MDTEINYFESILKGIYELEYIMEGIDILMPNPTEMRDEILPYYSDIDTWLKNINYMIQGTVTSVCEAMDFMQKTANYDPLNPSVETKLAFYFLENAMFRTTVLWDSFAQLCNVVFKNNFAIADINYKRYFKNTKCSTVEQKQLFEEIISYLDEDDNDEIDGKWRGNHKYVNNLRNSFTHRNNPHNIGFLNLFYNDKNKLEDSVTIPLGAIYENKRILEDFHQCYLFINRVVENYVEKDVDIIDMIIRNLEYSRFKKNSV